jgi:hypothetical protein
MEARVAERIEGIATLGAAVMFAVAVAYAISRLTASVATIGAAAATALFVVLQILRSIEPAERELPLACFEPAELVIEDLNELILTGADRLDQAPPCDVDDVLVLEDVLTELGDDSRVVRLFDASAMPTPGQLKARIDRHLDQVAHPYASAALHDALAELRRSLK